MSTLTTVLPKSENGCIVCSKDSNIECCKNKYCFIHIYGSKHAQHPSLWKNTNVVPERKKEIEKIIEKCIHELENDLVRMESNTNLSMPSSILSLPVLTPSNSTTTGVSPITTANNSTPTTIVPIGPRNTFESIRNKAMQQAAAKRTAQQRKEDEALLFRTNTNTSISSGNDIFPFPAVAAEGEEFEETPTSSTTNKVLDTSSSALLSLPSEDNDPSYRSTPKRLQMFHLLSSQRTSSSLSSSSSSLSSGGLLSTPPSITTNEETNLRIPEWITKTKHNNVRKNILNLLFTTFRDNIRKDAELRIQNDYTRRSSEIESSSSPSSSSVLEQKMRKELQESYAPKDEILQRICLDIEESLYNKYNTISLLLPSEKETNTNHEGNSSSTTDLSSIIDISSSGSTPISTPTDHEHQYRDHARILIQHLRNSVNIHLRDRILTAAMAPVQLVSLSYDELVPINIRQQRDSIRSLGIKQSTLDNEDSTIGWSTTNNVSCPGCNSKNTIYIPMTGVRDIRKAEIWGSGDDTTFKLKCNDCQYNWTSNNV